MFLRLKSPWLSIAPYHIQWAWTYLTSAYFSNLILCLPFAFQDTNSSSREFYTVLPLPGPPTPPFPWIVAYYFEGLDLHKGKLAIVCKCISFFSLPSTLLFPLKQVSSSVTISSLLVSYLPSVESQLCEDKARASFTLASLEPGRLSWRTQQRVNS